MKKIWLLLAMLVALCLPLSALAEEEVFFVLEYDGNGGYSGIAPQVIYPGETITLSDLWCSWEDHVFLGWATTSDATEAEYQRKDSFTADRDTTLYAVWMECHDLGVIDPAKTYTVSYPVEGGFAYLLFEVPADGYYYIHSMGRYLARGSGTTYLSPVEDSYDRVYPEKVNDDFEFVVELEAGTVYRMMYYHAKDPLQIEFSNKGFCLIEYDGNGGYSGIAPQVAKPGETITLSDLWCSWEDHVFLGWATTPDATEVEYHPKASITVAADTKLYAVWAEGKDLGTISGRREAVVSFPAEQTFAYIRFKAGYSGYYHIHSTGDYIAKGSGTTWLAPIEDSYDRVYPEKTDDDFSFVVKLTAGETYRIMYYHGVDPLPIVFQPQYEGKNYVSDIELTSAVRSVGDSAFEGTGLTHVAIPASMPEVNARTFAGCDKLESVLFYGMDTRIAPDAFVGCKDLVIIAPVGSTAQALAEQMGWDFLELK